MFMAFVFVAEILRRKSEAAKKRVIPPKKKEPIPMEYEKQSVIAVASVYGVDHMMDNVQACRERLYEIWDKSFKGEKKTLQLPGAFEQGFLALEE